MRARERLRIEVEGFRALEAAAADYGARMAALGRYREGIRSGKLDERRLADGHRDELMRRAGGEARLRAAKDEALDVGLGPAEIDAMVRGKWATGHAA